MKSARRPPVSFRPTGFTLVEIAIGLAIMGLATVGLLAALSKQAEQGKIATTRATVTQAQEALLAFAGTAGRLPCPALAATNGQEAIASNVGGVITCTAEAGFLPAVTLGMPGTDTDGQLNDGFADGAGRSNGTYLRSLRYGITRLAAPVANALSSPSLGAAGSATRRTDVQTAIVAGQGLFVCRSAAGVAVAVNRCGGVANTLSTNAAAIVWSRGLNGNDPARWSADELQNANQLIPRAYVSRAFAPANATGGAFDDQLTWIPWPMLAERLMRGGFAP